MNIKTIIIALLLFTSVTTGILYFANSFATSMGTSMSQEYLNDFNQSTKLQLQISEDYNTIQNLSSNSDSTFSIISLVPDALSIVKNLVVLPFTVSQEVLSSVQKYIKFPPWAIALILAVIALLFFIAILSIILRYNV